MTTDIIITIMIKCLLLYLKENSVGKRPTARSHILNKKILVNYAGGGGPKIKLLY